MKRPSQELLESLAARTRLRRVGGGDVMQMADSITMTNPVIFGYRSKIEYQLFRCTGIIKY